MSSTKKNELEGSTAHKQVPGDVDAGGASNADGPMPMGMTGTDGGPDPDQKSTHVSPKTVESSLPDGSPKFADPGKTKRGAKASAGRYEVVSPITTAVGGVDAKGIKKAKRFEPGDVVELDADEAESLGASVKPAR